MCLYFYVFMFQDWLGNLLFAYSIFSILSIIQILFFISILVLNQLENLLSHVPCCYIRDCQVGQVEVDGVQDQVGSYWYFGMEHWCFTKVVESGQAEVDGVQDQTNSTGCSVFSKFFIFISLSLLLFFLLFGI